MTDAKLPPANIQEFNEITTLIFAQLYLAFPVQKDLSADEIASALQLNSVQDMLPSGREFRFVFGSTLVWLIKEGLVHSSGPTPRERVSLTAKAMAVMNVIPDGVRQSAGPLGSQITQAASDTSSARGKTHIAQVMGDFLGSAVGSFTKSVSGG